MASLERCLALSTEGSLAIAFFHSAIVELGIVILTLRAEPRERVYFQVVSLLQM